MKYLLTSILDIIFPPSAEELILRNTSPVEAIQKIPWATNRPLPFITSLFQYKDPLASELIRQMKNKKNRHAYAISAYALYQKLSTLDGNYTLIPIPISKKRRRERGYNQCEILIDEIIKLDTIHAFTKNFTLLTRTAHLEDQKLKTRKDRLSNMTHVFTATPGKTTQRLILIDDVSTTGSTLDHARHTLMQAGYDHVTAFTVAH